MNIQKDRLLSPLPPINPGKDTSEWEVRRGEILSEIVDFEYGGFPPKPQSIRVEDLQSPVTDFSIKVYINETFNFMMKIFKPKELEAGKKYPIILTGDGCFRYCNETVINNAIDRGFLVAVFNRVEFAKDIADGGRTGGIYDMYPGEKFGAISAWAWGYSRAMDALETLPYVDAEKVAITGHSRGGKTVLLAGALDTRFSVVNPNDSGCGGCGCFRYRTEPKGELRGNERLSEILENFPYWFGEKLREYIGRDEFLPFDQHFLKAAVAPRKLLETNGREDTWANPKGSYITYEAAKEVFDLLGVPDNIAYRIREGGHAHTPEDFNALFAFIEDVKAVTDGYDVTPF
ncbi:MAG: acetylxylan esterase [Oscillospiraceae bacterium]|nr:acetylxylan esterase [Oscillospiraceae bacterium]